MSNNRLAAINGDNKVTSISLSNGEIVKADLVLLGTGISPNTVNI